MTVAPMAKATPAVLRRVTTPEGWYADVPHTILPKAALSAPFTWRLRALGEHEMKDALPPAPPGSVAILQGTVFHTDSLTSLVSCGGLRVKMGPGLADASHVRILLSAEETCS